MVLLDMLANNKCKQLHIERTNLIVAHFDHGIREDSPSDEKFVRGVVGDYGITYESARVDLGAHASEEKAREARYNFLRQCCKKYDAQLITAHHQDDLVETMIINLIRGTSWRGLVSLGSDSHTVRPLLGVSKKQLVNYAAEHKLQWREDNTNNDTVYLRNYVRHTLIPTMLEKDLKSISQLLDINRQSQRLKKEIATELQKVITQYQISNIKYVVPRYDLIMYSPLVAKELIYTILTQIDPKWHPSSQHIERVLHFIKTGRASKQLEVSKKIKIHLTISAVQFKKA
jgi:tRNA(Ile)-lysidine synthase